MEAEDVEEEPHGGTGRSQSVPGGGRSKNRGRSPARKQVAKDSALKKGKKTKAVDALRASFAKAAKKGKVIDVPTGGSSQATGPSHRGEGTV